MVLVHLVYFNVQFGEFLGDMLTEYTRFAAGGFVLLSGLCVGRIFLPKVMTAYQQNGNARVVYRRIWARAGRILMVQFATTILFFALNLPTGSRAALGHPWVFIADLLRFRKGNDLLLLYVGMLTVTPLLLELMRLRLWPLIAAGSAMLFSVVAWGAVGPWQVAFVPTGEFPLLLWQGVFITGLMLTLPLHAFDRAGRKTKIFILILVTVAFAVIFQSANARPLGFKHPWLPLTFWKIPLTFGEYLRYVILTLLIMLVTNAAWGILKNTRGKAFICLLGRNSLFVYVAHLYVQEAVALIVHPTRRLGLWQMGYAVAMIALLGAMAYGMERIGAAKKSPRPSPRPPQASEPPATSPMGFALDS